MNGHEHTAIKQGDSLVTEGKHVVLAVRQVDERHAVTALLKDMDMVVHHAEDGHDAIIVLEDNPCDMLLLDVHLSDMHAWKLLAMLRESIDLMALPTVVIMDEQIVVPLSNVTPVVRPVAMAKLRHIIFDLFSFSSDAPESSEN
jgi:PleD family two-component response regulator